MPFFDVICADHGRQETFSHSPADLRCPLCDLLAKRVWSAPPRAIIEFRDGFDPGFGQYISTKRERDNLLAQKNWRKVRS